MMTIKQAVEELKQGKLLTFLYYGTPQGKFYYCSKSGCITHTSIDGCWYTHTIEEFVSTYSGYYKTSNIKDGFPTGFDLFMNIY